MHFIQAPIGPYWLLLAPSGPYWLLLAPTGPFWPLLAPAGSYWLLPAPTAPTDRYGVVDSLRMQEAAAVAALIGNQTAGNALANAIDEFRALPLCMLTREDLRRRGGAQHGLQQDPEEQPDESEELRMLNLKTVSATLGSVDAFISHSWSDECDSWQWNSNGSRAPFTRYDDESRPTFPRSTLTPSLRRGRPKFDLLLEWGGSQFRTKRIWLDKVYTHARGRFRNAQSSYSPTQPL
jgi:hypothetical protein